MMKLGYLKTIFHLFILVSLSAGLFPKTLATNTTNELCHPEDKAALLQIKQQSFKNSSNFSSWDPNTDCCNGWSYVECDSTTNRINSLEILGSDTGGTPFPSALGDLPYLVQVVFHNNATGPIPSSLVKLSKRLNYLNLAFNQLTGPIPSFFSDFENLATLYLGYNALSGPLPAALVLAPALTDLDLGNNRFTGPIPQSYVEFLSDDNKDLALANNMLSGEIPRPFGKVKFFTIDVSGNKLKGDPTSVLFPKDNNRAYVIELSGNLFSFNMTNVEIPASLGRLDISNNRIYGSLPIALHSKPNLKRLNVSYNLLCGPIPTGGKLFRFDETSYFHNKCLCGTPLPPCK